MDRDPSGEFDDLGPAFLNDRTWQKLTNHFGLSPREREIVLGIFEGAKEQTIARRLDISPHTVHTYTRRLYRKLGASGRTQLVLSFFQLYAARSRWRSRSDTSTALPALTPPPL